MLIKPLSAIAEADDPAINAANYPGLIFGVNASSVTSSTRLTSLLGDITQSNSGTVTVDASGDFFATSASYGPTTTGTSGTLRGPTSAEKVLMLYVGTLASETVSIGFGDPVNGPGFGAAVAGSNAGGPVWVLRTAGAGNYHDLPNLTKTDLGGTHGVMALSLDISGNAGKLHAIDDTGFESASTVSAAGTLAGNWGDISTGMTAKLRLPVSANIYGVYLFYLDALPTDDEIKAICGWMYANPTRVHPNLIGRT